MMGITAIEVVFLLLYIVIVTIPVLIIMFESPTYNEKDYERYYRRKMQERDGLYKILLDSLDKAEDMLKEDGDYLFSNDSNPNDGINGKAMSAIENNDLLIVDFSSALTALKEGKRIKRLTWNVSMRLHADGQIRVISENGDIAEVVTVIGIFDLPFRLEDILAEDWQIID